VRHGIAKLLDIVAAGFKGRDLLDQAVVEALLLPLG
jgi:hypothetical protein